jgi:hypothetical protein
MKFQITEMLKTKKTGRILKPGLRNRYEYVNLSNGINIRKKFQIHRLVLFTFEGKSKDEKQIFVDHIDNNKSNNCLFNLRWVSNQQNQFNSPIAKTNTSTVRGVSFHKKFNKWIAYIQMDGKLIHLGYFNNLEDAKLARQNKAKELFGQYIGMCEVV